MAREDEDRGALSASEIQPGHNKRKLVACSDFDERLQRSSTAEFPSLPPSVPGSSSRPALWGAFPNPLHFLRHRSSRSALLQQHPHTTLIPWVSKVILHVRFYVFIAGIWG